MQASNEPPIRPVGRRFIVALGVAAAIGCGDSPFDIVPVSGTVAYEDGTPIPADGFRLKFVPQVDSPDGKTFPRVATAIVDAQGAFTGATTYRYNDGLVNGNNLVYLELGSKKDAAKLVSRNCLASKTTPLSIDVAKSRRLEIRVPRP